MASRAFMSGKNSFLVPWHEQHSFYIRLLSFGCLTFLNQNVQIINVIGSDDKNKNIDDESDNPFNLMLSRGICLTL